VRAARRRGPPGYQDGRQGDTPEPILQLDEPQCFVGNEELAAEGEVSRAHLFVAGDEHPELWQSLRMLIGRHVTVSGASRSRQSPGTIMHRW
jgi:hypothetical protein